MEILANNFGLILSLLGGAVATVWGFIVNKKNRNLSNKLQEVEVKLKETSVDSNKIKVATENFEFYQTMLDDAHERYQTLMNQYEQETAKLSKLLEEARRMVDTHEQYITKQRLYVAELEALLRKNNINFKDEDTQ